MAIQTAFRLEEELLAALKEHVDSKGINPAAGAHMGYIPGGGIFPTAMGDYLCLSDW